MKIILCKTQSSTNNGTKIVKQLANYIYQHVDNAYKKVIGPSQSDVYIDITDDENNISGSCNVNITTYNKYIRINIIILQKSSRTVKYNRYNIQDFAYGTVEYGTVVDWINTVLSDVNR